jgi:streptogramin lyase
VARDVPMDDRNEYRSGSDWSWGTRDEHLERGTHDIALGNDGNIYFGMNAMSSDLTEETIWWGGRPAFTSLDVKTQTITTHSKPPAALSHGTSVDTKGNVWGSTGLGAVRMNIQTGELTLFKTVAELSRPYDMGVDRLDNVWLSEIALDKMAVIDSRTGDITEVSLPPLKSPDLRPEDIEMFKTVGSWDHNAALGQEGPRRMGADRNGDYVYAGTYWGGGLVQIDVRTKTLVGIHQVPNGRWAQPYKPVADTSHMLWFSNSAADMLGKFNPTTKKFVMYPLPTRGTNSRDLAVDKSTNPPTVYVPYTGAGKVARVQFRTDTSK